MLFNELHFPVENIIFPVGQGGLFLGLIKYQQSQKSKTKTFAYIYDCGNIQQTYLESSINNLINILKITNEISPLTYIYIFISHVHKDHISGLKFLKQKLEKCRLKLDSSPVLVMPYMDEAEKDLILKLNILDKRYTAILTNPYLYFDGYFDIQYVTDKLDEPDKSKSLDYENTNKPLKYNYGYSIPEAKSINNGNPEIKTFSHNQNFRFDVHYCSWILKPFYHRFNIPNDLRESIQQSGYNSIYDINFDNINSQLRKELENKLNVSSLCLYSGPSDGSKSCGWMHTGDFNFKHKEAFEKFQTHYVSVLNNVQILQIPHHGSKKNSSNKDFKIFPNLANKYVTIQSNPKGRKEPRLSPEYINDETIYLATENARIKKYLNNLL